MKKKKRQKCGICCQAYGIWDLDKHMHSAAHHQAIERLKGSEHVHKCWACTEAMMGIELYLEHIATTPHKCNLNTLQQKRRRGHSLQVDYNIELNDDERKAQKIEKVHSQRCFVCAHPFIMENIDSHMHSLAHHYAIETIMGSEYAHTCWACDVSVVGYKLYKQHFSSWPHNSKLMALQEARQQGKKVLDYSKLDELITIAAKKKGRKNCKQKKQEKWKATKDMKKAKREMKNKSQSLGFTTPVLPYSDQLPPSYCNSFFQEESQQNLSKTNELNQKLPKRSLLDMDGSHFPLLKRSCLEVPSENPAQEVSACGRYCEKVANGCASELISENELGVSAERTCAPGLIQRHVSCISTMVRTIRKSMDKEGLATGSAVNTESHLEGMVGQLADLNEAFEANRTEQLDKRPKQSRKEIPKGNTSKRSVSSHVPENTVEAPCLNDVISECKVNEKNSSLQASKKKLQQDQGMSRKSINGQVASLPTLAEMLASPASGTYNASDCQIIRNREEHQQHFMPVKQEKSNNIEQGETSLNEHDSCEIISYNHQTKRKKRDVSNTTRPNPDTNDTFQKKQVDELMSVSLKEEELTTSLENINGDLLHAYATLQKAYTEVQRLLAVKQDAATEMTSLRAKRISILQEMKNGSYTPSSAAERFSHVNKNQ